MKSRVEYFSGYTGLPTLSWWYFLSVLLLSLIANGQDFRQFNDYSFQPEVWQFEGGVEGGVNAKGDLGLQIPVMTVPGSNGLDFPIIFNYKAGIAFHQRATWLGLGWNFDPGSITRDVQADYLRNNVVYGVDYNDDPDSYAFMPDQYYLTIPGRGTLTMARANLAGFNDVSGSTFWAPYHQNGFYFEEHKPYRVEFEMANPAEFDWGSFVDQNHQYIKYFVITTDDGTRYIYSLPTIASFQSKIGPNSVPVQYPSAWRLVAIAGYDFDGNIEDLLQPLLAIPGNAIPPALSDKHSWILFRYRYDENELVRRYGADNNGNILIQEHTYLKWIITPTHRAEFVSYADRDDIDINNLDNHPSHFRLLFRRLTEIQLHTTEGDLVSRVTLDHDYLLGKKGNYTPGKLTLQGINFESYDGQINPGYVFDYPPQESDGNPGWEKWSLEHWYDGFGYYNNRVLPQLGIDDDTTDAKAWSLIKVTFPSGGWEAYEYSNDAIDNSPFTYKVVKNYPESSDPPGTVKTEEFDFDLWKGGSSCRRQGGVRVRKITRGDGMGNTSEVSYRYGKGYVACMPPRLIPFIYADLVPNQFVSYNRGDMDVHYTWVEKRHQDGDYQRTWYHISQTPISAMIYQDYYRGNNYVFITDNAHLSDGLAWGTPLATVNRHARIVDSTSYTFDTTIKHPSDIVRNVGFENIRYQFCQISPLQTLVTASSDDGSGLVINNLTARNYYSDTRQLRQEIQQTDEWKLRTNYTYAHQKSSYAYQSWIPAQVNGMRADNLLAPIAETDQYFDDLKIAASWRVGSAQRVTYDDGLTDGLIPRWKPHRVYQLKDGLHNTAPPAFDGWYSDEPSDTRWQEYYRIESYRHGKPVIFRDANNALLEVFYGDNDHNFSNAPSADGLFHSQITGVRVGNFLSRQFDYHPRFYQAENITDEAGQSMRFSFDSFGRLIAAYDAQDRLLSEYSYHFSRQNGASFNSLSPNYLQTKTYYDASKTSVAVTWFDGLGRTLQSVLRADEKDTYQANLLDQWGRLLRQYKPYSLPASGTTLSFDSDFDRRLEDGTLHSVTTNRYTGNAYRSITGGWVDRTTFPGGTDDDNANQFFRTRVLASDILPEKYTASPPIIWQRESMVDENGNELATFMDPLGRKMLERRYKGQSTVATTIDIYAMCDKFCSPETGNTDQQTFTLPYRQAVTVSGNIFTNEHGIVEFEIYESGNPSNVFFFLNSEGPVEESVILESGSYVVRGYAQWPSSSANTSAIVDLQIQLEKQTNTAELLSSTCFDYDGNGNPLTVYPPNWFQPPAESQPDDWISTFAYNTLGQLTEKRSPDAGLVHIKYDDAGNLRFSQDARQQVQGLVSYFEYDFNNRLVESGAIKADFESLDPSATGQVPENLFNPQTINAYDAAPDWEDFPWNNHPASSYPTTLSNTGGRLAAQAQISDEAWQVVVYSYDANGRIAEKTIRSDGMPATTLTYQYDRQGQLLQTTTAVGDDTWTHFNTYDQSGRLISVATSGNGQMPTYKDVAYSYNPTGTLAATALAEYSGGYRQQFGFDYNPRDWMLSIGDINNGENLFAAQYEYQDNGNINEAIFRNAGAIGNNAYRHTFGYDDLYRLTAADYANSPSAQYPPESAAGWVISNHFKLSGISYDDNGNILSLKRRDESGMVADELEYAYDSQNCLQTLIDNAGVTAADWDAETCTFSYDPNGNMTMLQDADHGYRFLRYDYRNLPEAIVEPDPSALAVRLETSAQNGAGWWGTVRYSVNAGAYQSFSGRGLHILQVNQNTGALIESAVYDMYYDGNSGFLGDALADYLDNIPADGRLVLFGVLNSAYYSTTNQEWTEAAYQAMERFGAGKIRDLRHKDNYSLFAISGQPHASIEKLVPYFYHNSQSPRCVTETRAKVRDVVNYRYNAAGQRIYKQIDGLPAEHYIVDENRILGTWQDGNPQFWNIFGNGVVGHALLEGSPEQPGGGEPVEPGSISKFFYLKDHLGSTRLIMDAAGEIKSAYDYYPFGLKMPGRAFVSGSEHSKVLFTGKERDSESGWDYFGARYYQPAIGRWMTVDPLAEKYPEFSPYNYVANSPLQNVDRDGKEWYLIWEEDTKDGETTKIQKWKWYDESDKSIWNGEFDENGDKIYETVEGQDGGFFAQQNGQWAFFQSNGQMSEAQLISQDLWGFQYFSIGDGFTYQAATPDIIVDQWMTALSGSSYKTLRNGLSGSLKAIKDNWFRVEWGTFGAFAKLKKKVLHFHFDPIPGSDHLMKHHLPYQFYSWRRHLMNALRKIISSQKK